MELNIRCYHNTAQKIVEIYDNRVPSSNRANRLLQIWTILGLLTSHWYETVSVIYFVQNPLGSKWMLAYFVMDLSTSASIYKIVYRRKVLARLTSDICSKLRHLNPDAYRACVNNFKTWLGVVAIFSVSQIACVTYLRITRSNDIEEWIKLLAFGQCGESPTCLKMTYVFDGLAYGGILYGLTSLFNLKYCFVARVIANCLKAINEKMQNRGEITSLLTEVDSDLEEVKNYVASLNGELQYLVLMWLLIAFILSCNGLLCQIISSPHEDLLETYHQIFVHFHLLLLLFLTVYTASKMERALETTRNSLLQMATRRKDLNLEIQLIYWKISKNNMLLKAGDCFPITSKLFVSYIGFGLTYTIIFMQIHPQALTAFQNMFFSREN